MGIIPSHKGQNIIIVKLKELNSLENNDKRRLETTQFVYSTRVQKGKQN